MNDIEQMTSQTNFLGESPKAVARRGDPKTSWDAAASIRNITKIAQNVMYLLYRDGPMIDDELCKRYVSLSGKDIAYSTVRTRRGELSAEGWVVATDIERTNDRGNRVTVWRALWPDEHEEWLRKQAEEAEQAKADWFNDAETISEFEIKVDPSSGPDHAVVALRINDHVFSIPTGNAGTGAALVNAEDWLMRRVVGAIARAVVANIENIESPDGESVYNGGREPRERGP